MHKPNRERRRAPRIQADLPLQLTSDDKAHGPAGAAQLKDISTIGLCCNVPEPIPEMTLVRACVELEGRSHKIDGAVVRCEREEGDLAGWEVAVYFTHVGSDAYSSLDTYIDSKIKTATA